MTARSCSSRFPWLAMVNMSFITRHFDHTYNGIAHILSLISTAAMGMINDQKFRLMDFFRLTFNKVAHGHKHTHRVRQTTHLPQMKCHKYAYTGWSFTLTAPFFFNVITNWFWMNKKNRPNWCQRSCALPGIGWKMKIFH